MTKENLKLVGLAILVLLALIVAVQNLRVEEISFWPFGSVRLPLVLELLIMMGVGFAIGVLTSLIVTRKGKKQPEEQK